MASHSQELAPERRYWPNGDVHSTAFLARYPDLRRLTEEARHAANGEIIFWHPWHMEKTWVHQKLESPIDWGRVRTGDEEWPHALARLSHLVDLAAGWRLTGDSQILKCYWDHVTQFCRSRRETDCHLWPNRLDSALRIFHFIKSYDLLNQTDASTDQQRQLLFEQIQFEVDFLLDGLGSKVGNWELIICCALLTAAEYLHGVVDTQTWRDKASARLQELLKTEIQPDGHWVEQAPMYHGECIIALADYVTILKTNNLPVPDWLLKATQSLLVTLEEITDPQGKIPQIGDSDSFETAYISKLCEVLLGEQTRGEDATETKPPLVKVYQPTGWAVSKWNDPATGKKYQLIFDASGKPPKRRQWHSHADDLQVVLTSSDGPILVDPGRFTYSSVLGPSNPTIGRLIHSSGIVRRLYGMFASQHRELVRTDWRQHFSSTGAHNTVSRDRLEQSGYGQFESENPAVRLLPLVTGHAGSEFLLRGIIEPDPNAASGYRHTRAVIGLLPHLVLVIDDLAASEPHEWIASWHFGQEMQVTSEGQACTIRNATSDLRMSIYASSHSEMRVEQGWVSDQYNLKHRSSTARTLLKGTKSVRCLTVIRLTPLGRSFETEKLEVSLGSLSMPFDRIKLDSGDHSLIIWHQDEPKRFTDGEFTIDKELFVHRT